MNRLQHPFCSLAYPDRLRSGPKLDKKAVWLRETTFLELSPVISACAKMKRSIIYAPGNTCSVLYHHLARDLLIVSRNFCQIDKKFQGLCEVFAHFKFLSKRSGSSKILQ